MTKYRKKPVVVDAIQFTRETYDDVRSFTKRKAHSLAIPRGIGLKASCKIDTLEGAMTATEGDYIIKGVAGEFYPCRADIFEATYELAEEGETK